MKTTVVKIDPANFEPKALQSAADFLRKGDLVAFPTETVYGLGAAYNNDAALRRIFETKGRPSDNPLIIHIWQRQQLTDLVTEVDPKFKKLMDAFWPGPLTLVFPKQAAVSDLVTAGLTTVAIRMPVHPVAFELLRLTGFPVAAPSANRSGRPSPTRGGHVMDDFDGKIPMIIDAGTCNAGIESTVVVLEQRKPFILRPGSITREMLEEVLKEPITVATGESTTPSSPGMKYRHYAPKAPVILVEGSKNEIVGRINSLLRERRGTGKIMVIGSTENLSQYETDWILDFGPGNQLELAAMRLYELLRICDELRVDQIIIEGVDGRGIGAALTNRLHKASGGNVIHVS